jgi:hypothetical protein
VCPEGAPQKIVLKEIITVRPGHPGGHQTLLQT